MCGRYFWTDDAEDAFLEDFPDLAGEVMRLRAGDYTPGGLFRYCRSRRSR